jgi:hypothetical protein
LLGGCSRSNDKIAFFFCGCDPCSQLATTLGPESFSESEVYYAGSLGDANEFGSKHGLSAVEPDPDRSHAKSMGVKTCPSVVLGRGAQKVIGNGSEISESDMETIRDAIRD